MAPPASALWNPSRLPMMEAGDLAMYAMLCAACRQPMSGEGFEVSLLRGAVVRTPDEAARLAATEGVLSATLCSRCGERLAAIVQTKLEAPCPTCEVAPVATGDARAANRAGMLRRAS